MIYQQIVLYFDKVNLLFYLLFYYYFLLLIHLNSMFVCLLFCTLYMHVYTHNLIHSHICILFLLLLGNAMNSTCERLCACLFKNKYKKQSTNTRKCTKNQLNDQQTKGILCLWRDQPERERERESSSNTSPSPAFAFACCCWLFNWGANYKSRKNKKYPKLQFKRRREVFYGFIGIIEAIGSPSPPPPM